MPACLISSRDCPRDTSCSFRDTSAATQGCQRESQKSHSWIHTPISLQCTRGSPSHQHRSHCRDAAHPWCLPSPTAAADRQELCPALVPTSAQQEHGEHLPCWGCVPLHFPIHITTHQSPSHSHSAAPSPATQTTDLIFLFLNTQRSSPSAAKPLWGGKRNRVVSVSNVPPPQISLHILPCAVSSKRLGMGTSHVPPGWEMVLGRGWGGPCCFWLHADGSNSTSFSFTAQSISPEAPKGVPWLAPCSEKWGDTTHVHASPSAQ